MRILIKTLFIIALCFSVSNLVLGFDSSRPNNKFGIHLAVSDDTDLDAAADLVNSAGGKWGYVTLVIQEDDRNHEKWQRVFDRLRELRLIPLVRLATKPEGDKWRKPTKEDADSWASFLDSLNWVVKDRYVILFNEPNHGREWGGAVDPKDYMEVSEAFAKKLKEKNGDYFIMLAGFDASSPSNPPFYEDEAVFLQQMIDLPGDIFDLIDGWASHSYPNPGFVGSPYASGRGSIRGYEWELFHIRNAGITKELPVFITETGWPHSGDSNPSFYSPDTLGEYMRIAYEYIWVPDGRVRAATPFILNYQGDPFTSFSWKKRESAGMDFYPHYYAVKSLPKKEGEPEQIQTGGIVFDFPEEILVSSTYHFKIRVKNTGQAIWDKDDGYELSLGTSIGESFFSDLDSVKPGEETEVDFYLKTGKNVGKNKANISLFKNREKILNGGNWPFTMSPLPRLHFKTKLFPKVRADEKRTYEIQIFDEKEQLVFKKSGYTMSKGKGVVNAVPNVYFGRKFRIVILTPHYLPRQGFVRFKKGENTVVFRPMLPFDFDRDGAFRLKDIRALFQNPKLFGLLLP